MEFKLVKLEATNLLTYTINKLNNIDVDHQESNVKGFIWELLKATRGFAEKEECFVNMGQLYNIIKAEVKKTEIVDIIYDITNKKEVPLVISPFSNMHEPLGAISISDYLQYAHQPHYWIKVINKYLENINSSIFIELTLDKLTALIVSQDISEIQPVAMNKDFFHGLLNEAVKAVVAEDDMPKYANSPVTLELAFKQSVSMLFDEFLPSNSYSVEITEGMKILEEQLKSFIDLGNEVSNRPRYIDERPYGGEPTPVRFGPNSYGNSRRYQNVNHGSPFWSLDPHYEPLPNKDDIKQYLEFLKADVEMAMTMLNSDTSEPEWDRLVNSLTHSCSSVTNWFKQRGR